jgi:hypothetical protein
MRMRARVVTVAAIGSLAVLSAASPGAAGPESDLLVRHGQGIGKLRLGMTLPQVKSLLGAPRAVNKKERRGGRGYVYVELDWDWARWTVGFMRPRGGRYRAVLIGTIQRTQRTPEGLGVGSSDSDLFRKLADLRCRMVFPASGGSLTHAECVYGRAGGRQTVFIKDKWSGHDDPSIGIAQVEVRDPLFYRGWPVKLRSCDPPC